MTTIKKCTCKEYKGNAAGANFQNVRYGENMRAHNRKAGDPPKWVCSICNKEQGGEAKK